MIKQSDFFYYPSEHECEKASNSYVMSLAAVIAGIPLPIINLIATVAFYFVNRERPYFVRWHCTQALLSQVAIFPINAVCFWWTVSVLFYAMPMTGLYYGFLGLVFICNLLELISTIYAAVQTRKGIHVKFWFFGNLTDAICKPSSGRNI